MNCFGEGGTWELSFILDSTLAVRLSRDKAATSLGHMRALFSGKKKRKK